MSPIKKHPIIAWFCDNSVVANILLFIILGLGISTAISVRKEAFPSFDAQSVKIQVPFRGGTPQDVERGVSIKIEEALQGVDGIARITSTSTASRSVVTVEAIEDYPISKLLDQIKIQVDSISSFPQQAENYVISERKRSSNVLRINLHGDVSEALLKETARTLRDDLMRLSTVRKVSTSGTREYQISIEVSENKLRRYNLTFKEVATAISDNSINLAGGSIRSSHGNISIRSQSQAFVAADFGNIPLRVDTDGTRILLSEVAQIRDSFIDQPSLSRFNGARSAGLQITMEGNGDIIATAKQAADLIQHYPSSHGLPAGISLTTWQDGSEPIRSRLKLLIGNGLSGIILVLITLALFLNFKLALWVALGIPISIAGALACFPAAWIDISLNQLTAFAFIIVLGIIVDDAIVIGESIYSSKEDALRSGKNNSDLSATVRGVSKVVTPATFGVLTTVAAFYPLTQVTGRMGNVFGQIASAVILCLIFSLIESKLILPAHLKNIKVQAAPKNIISRNWVALQSRMVRGLELSVSKLYQPALRWLIPRRYITLASFIAILMLVIGLLPSGQLRFVFFPSIFRDSISANIELEQGLPVDYLHANATSMAAALKSTIAELEAESGDRILRHIAINASNNTQASIAAELTTSESRITSTAAVVKAWRAKVGLIEGAKALTFAGTAGPRGQGVNIQLASSSLDELQIAASAMKKQLARYQGVYDIRDSFDAGQPEINIELTPMGQAAGFKKIDLISDVRSAFFGQQAQRIQRGRDEVRVMVRYPEQDRSQLETLRTMHIRSADGSSIPFSIAADSSYGSSLAAIERADSNRIVSVMAEIDKATTSGDKVLALLAEEYFVSFRSKYPGIRISLYGESEQRIESMQSLRSGFQLSLLLIYILIAIPLKSYVKPLFIMSVIPFGIIGALFGHYIIGIPVSILSLFGILALSGIVVNDSLVLLYRVDELTKAQPQLSLAEVIICAGGQRFRAILLTTLTTFVGLIPLLAEPSVQAQFLKPMAVSVGFGVLFATAITLILLPMTLLIAQDFKLATLQSWQYWQGLIRRQASK